MTSRKKCDKKLALQLPQMVCLTFDSSRSISYNPNCKIYYLSLFEALHRRLERKAATPGTAITRPTENICGNSKRSSVGRTIVQSHEPCGPVVRSGGWKAKTATSCRNAFMTNILLARGSSHARGKRPPAVEINSSSTQPYRLDFLSYFEL